MGFNPCCCCDRSFQNVIILSVSFMLIFTAFQTMGNIEKTVLASITAHDPTFTGDGYTSLAIIYAVFSLANWVAPSVVAVLKAKATMVLGAILYTGFIASFLYPSTWVLYAMSATLGFGAALLWTAQGNYLILCSNEETMSRNSGVFWAILQCSMFLGNSFVFWQFHGKTEIDEGTRTLVFTVLTGVATLGVLSLFFLRSPSSEIRLEAGAGSGGVSSHVHSVEVESRVDGALGALRSALHLITRRDMLLLSLTFLYTGIELSFFSGVYSSAIGFTGQLGLQAKRLVGLCGILVGVGEVLGGALFGLLGSRTVKNGRDPIVLLGFICHTIAFYLVFINLPDESPLGKTEAVSYMDPPSGWIAMICAFLLGFGDSCFNTQIYSIIGRLYQEESAPAFALFKFTQSAAAAASFFYSSVLTLRIQLFILQVFCLLGTWTFFLVEWRETRKRLQVEFERNTSVVMDDDE